MAGPGGRSWWIPYWILVDPHCGSWWIPIVDPGGSPLWILVDLILDPGGSSLWILVGWIPIVDPCEFPLWILLDTHRGSWWYLPIQDMLFLIYCIKF